MNQENKQLSVILTAERQEFLTVLSHELRTPMTVIKGYLAMTLDGDAGELNDQMRKYITAAFTANEKAIQLVSEMMHSAAKQEESKEKHD